MEEEAGRGVTAPVPGFADGLKVGERAALIFREPPEASEGGRRRASKAAASFQATGAAAPAAQERPGPLAPPRVRMRRRRLCAACSSYSPK